MEIKYLIKNSNYNNWKYYSVKTSPKDIEEHQDFKLLKVYLKLILNILVRCSNIGNSIKLSKNRDKSLELLRNN